MTPAPVYPRASAPNKAAARPTENGQPKKTALHPKKASPQPNYTTLLQHVRRTNPEKGAELIITPAAAYKETRVFFKCLASIPVSFPLIGRAQLVQYLAVVKVNNPTPGSFCAFVHGAAGHSPGTTSTVVLTTSTTEEPFLLNSIKASKWLFYSGLCGQEVFPVLAALEPRITQDTIEGDKGYPTPMLVVSGLSRSTLESCIAKTNAHLPENAQLPIGLQNGAKVPVIVGPACLLYGLVTALRKIRAPARADQSKIVLSMHFLVANVPCHGNYLQGVTEKVFETDLEGKDPWIPEELVVPVFHTKDGMSSVFSS